MIRPESSDVSIIWHEPNNIVNPQKKKKEGKKGELWKWRIWNSDGSNKTDDDCNKTRRTQNGWPHPKYYRDKPHNNNKLIAALLPSVPRIIHMIITQTHCCASTGQPWIMPKFSSFSLSLSLSLFKYYQTQTVRIKHSPERTKSRSYRNNKFANKETPQQFYFINFFFFFQFWRATFSIAIFFLGYLSSNGQQGPRKKKSFGRLDNNNNNIFYMDGYFFFPGRARYRRARYTTFLLVGRIFTESNAGL